MDLATVGGLLIAIFSVIGATIIKGLPLYKLFEPGALLLILGGTFGATMLSFSMTEIKNLPKILIQAFKETEIDPTGIINTLVRFAEKARREGLLVLEDDAAKLEDKFLQKGIQLVVDGTDMELIRSILQTELAFLEERHKIGENFFMTMGGFAPTLGVLGAVVGLIVALWKGGGDPVAVAKGISVAFLAAFYGIGSANVIFIPIANKLRLKSSREILLREVMIEGILSIQAGDNPRIVEEKLKAFLPPAMRQQIKGRGAREITEEGERA